MGRQSIEPPVLKYLLGLEDGSTITVEAVATYTGLQIEQVRSVMYRLTQSGKVDLSVISRANAWMLKSKSPRTESSQTSSVQPGSRFTCVGAKKDGTRLVQDESGKLYELQEI